jgi:hypothetical protein
LLATGCASLPATMSFLLAPGAASLLASKLTLPGWC